MALPSAKFYTTGDVLIITTQEFGSVQAGAYSTGKTFRLYNDYSGGLDSETATSVKLSVRGPTGGTDEVWVQQHWVQLKSDGCSTSGIVDDAQTIYTAVGKNKELSVGDIPQNKYRTIYARCYPPTDAAENPDIDFQLRVTYQQPATSICNWITGLRGNGVVASTGDPFAMSTTGATDPIPYQGGCYALIDNNEIYYGSSGTYDITTTGSGTYKIYLNESGAFGETTGDVAANQLELYEATISSGVCTALTDKRVYLAGLQAGTTGAIPTTPDLGDLYLDITNGRLYAAKTSTGWTVIVPGATFVALTDTPENYTGSASKLLRVNSSSGAVEFVSTTGIASDTFGPLTDITTNNATSGKHGFLPKLSGSSGEYLNGDATFAVPPASDIKISEIGTATYDDIQDWLDNTQSGGIVAGATISDDGDGTITLSSGQGYIRTTTGDIGLTKAFDIAADSSTGVALTDNSTNFVYVDYNAGSPKFAVTTDRGTIRLSDQFDVGRVYRSGTDLHIINSGNRLYNLPRIEHERLLEVRGFERASGGVVSEVGERYLGVTAGTFYLGQNKITTTAQDTSTGGGDYFTSYYYISGAWASSTGQQQIDNTYYNDTSATGLVALTVNRYGVHWIYIHYDSEIHTVYGQGDYTLAQAEIAVVPDTLPNIVGDFGKLAAKVILKQGSTGFTSVVTAYETLFPVSSPPDHNDLGGLQGGTVDQYYHLTSVEHDEITGDEQAIVTTTGTAAIDWGDGRNAFFTRSTGANGAVTFSFTAPTISANLSLIIRGSTAGSTGGVTWPTVYWQGGSVPSLSSGVSAIDKIRLYYSTGLSGYLGDSLINYSTV